MRKVQETFKHNLNSLTLIKQQLVQQILGALPRLTIVALTFAKLLCFPKFGRLSLKFALLMIWTNKIGFSKEQIIHSAAQPQHLLYQFTKAYKARHVHLQNSAQEVAVALVLSELTVLKVAYPMFVLSMRSKVNTLSQTIKWEVLPIT